MRNHFHGCSEHDDLVDNAQQRQPTLSLVDAAQLIRDSPERWVLTQFDMRVNLVSDRSYVGAYFKMRLVSTSDEVACHLTVLHGPRAPESQLKHMARREANFKDAISELKHALVGKRYMSDPNFAECEVIPLHREGQIRVQRVLVHVHVRGLLHDRIRRVAQIAAVMHSIPKMRDLYHVSVDLAGWM